MQQNELLVDVLRRDLGLLKLSLADISESESLQRPVPNANNVIWQLGHLIASEAQMVNQCAGTTVIELPKGFADRYKRETSGTNDPAMLGNKADLLALLDRVRGQTADWVATLTAADLAKPTSEQMRKFLPTVGHFICLLPTHVAMHLGQIQVLRRRLGKPIIF